MTETVISRQETALQGALSKFSDTIAAAGLSMTPAEVKAAVLDVCIDMQMPVKELPEPLVELYKAANSRIDGLERFGFNADGLQRVVLQIAGASGVQ